MAKQDPKRPLARRLATQQLDQVRGGDGEIIVYDPVTKTTQRIVNTGGIYTGRWSDDGLRYLRAD